MTAPDSSSDRPEQDSLLQAAQAVLGPLARLMVARGVHFSAVEEQLKAAFVVAAREAALQATPQALPHRLVSRISTATGINRREVTRLVGADTSVAPHRPPPALRVFARWTTDPRYLDDQGQPLTLPRSGEAPSFEALAASVTKDVHPRSLLDDMLRLKVALWDAVADQVSLSREHFVPHHDRARSLGYLGGHVGDHLSAAVDNVLNLDEPPHFEQAIHANGLSAQSLAQVRGLVTAQWKPLVAALVPALQEQIEADAQAGRPTEGRVCIGLYAYSTEGVPPATVSPAPVRADDDE